MKVCQHRYHLNHYFLLLAQFLAQNYCLNNHHFIRLLLTISVHKQLSDHFFDGESLTIHHKKIPTIFHFCKMHAVHQYSEWFPLVVSIMGCHSCEQQPPKQKYWWNGYPPFMGCGHKDVWKGLKSVKSLTHALPSECLPQTLSCHQWI